MKQSILDKMKGAHIPETRSFRLEIDEKTCKSCRMCVDTCPTSCLKWDAEKGLPYGTGLGSLALACLGCNNCEAICPSGSIRARGEYRVISGRYKTPEDQAGEMTSYSPLNDASGLEDEPKLNETEQVIYNRRSIRIFKEKPVPEALIRRVIEAARFAPSAGNGQPWKFIVVTDRAFSDRIDQECAKILKMISWLYTGRQWWRKFSVTALSLFQINKWDQRPIAAMEKIRHLEKGRVTFNAPVVIHLLKDKRGISHPDADVAIAAQNLVLAAHSLGLGTCYIGFIASTIKYAPKIRKMLGFDYPYELVTSICLGYPKVKSQNQPVPRRPVSIDWIS